MLQSFRDVAQVNKIKRAYSISVSNTPQQISISRDVLWVFIYNNSTNTVYIGDASVSPTTGFPIPSNTSFGIAVFSPSEANFYLVSNETSSDIRIIEFI
jgi:hypothetical protein